MYLNHFIIPNQGTVADSSGGLGDMATPKRERKIVKLESRLEKFQAKATEEKPFAGKIARIEKKLIRLQTPRPEPVQVAGKPKIIKIRPEPTIEYLPAKIKKIRPKRIKSLIPEMPEPSLPFIPFMPSQPASFTPSGDYAFSPASSLPAIIEQPETRGFDLSNPWILLIIGGGMILFLGQRKKK